MLTPVLKQCCFSDRAAIPWCCLDWKRQDHCKSLWVVGVEYREDRCRKAATAVYNAA